MRRPATSRRPSGRGAANPAGRAASAAVKRHSRAERAKQIERLERRGLGTAEIAAELGLASSTVNIYRRDPDGSRHRQRLERYRGRCDDCGRPTSGSGGRARAPARCRRCAAAQRRVWPGEMILQRIKDWTAETGSPPRVRDWSPAHAPAGHQGGWPLPGRAWALAERQRGRRSLRLVSRGSHASRAQASPAGQRIAAGLDARANRRGDATLVRGAWLLPDPQRLAEGERLASRSQHRLPGLRQLEGGAEGDRAQGGQAPQLVELHPSGGGGSARGLDSVRAGNSAEQGRGLGGLVQRRHHTGRRAGWTA
jgi:DNA-binding CsgD family transcriptional regulator